MAATSKAAATTYEAGHVKRDKTTGSVAVRTTFAADQFPGMVWLVATSGMGASNASDSDVSGWDDLYVAPAPVAPDTAP